MYTLCLPHSHSCEWDSERSHQGREKHTQTITVRTLDEKALNTRDLHNTTTENDKGSEKEVIVLMKVLSISQSPKLFDDKMSQWKRSKKFSNFDNSTLLCCSLQTSFANTPTGMPHFHTAGLILWRRRYTCTNDFSSSFYCCCSRAGSDHPQPPRLQK